MTIIIFNKKSYYTFFFEKSVKYKKIYKYLLNKLGIGALHG